MEPFFFFRGTKFHSLRNTAPHNILVYGLRDRQIPLEQSKLERRRNIRAIRVIGRSLLLRCHYCPHYIQLSFSVLRPKRPTSCQPKFIVTFTIAFVTVRGYSAPRPLHSAPVERIPSEHTVRPGGCLC